MVTRAYNRRILNTMSVSNLKKIKKDLKVCKSTINADLSTKSELISQLLQFFKNQYISGNLYFSDENLEVIEDTKKAKVKKVKSDATI